MRLATRRDGTRDGALVVVADDGLRCRPAAPIARTLQAALDDWASVAPALRSLADALDADRACGEPLDLAQLMAPLPRAYQWIDASGYLSHMERVRRARGAELPPAFRTEPVMYQGLSDHNLAWNEPIPSEPAWGTDLEGELAVLTTDVPAGATAGQALASIALVVLVNDVSLRGLIPDELAKGFGFFVGKPASAHAPFAVTPDALGGAWRDGKLAGRLTVAIGERRLGDLSTGGDDQDFSFPDILQRAARTRRLGAGSIVGAGTVSNRDASRGVACLAEARILEQLHDGAASTPWLADGDEVRLRFFHADGREPFGPIEQRVVERGAEGARDGTR